MLTAAKQYDLANLRWESCPEQPEMDKAQRARITGQGGKTVGWFAIHRDFTQWVVHFHRGRYAELDEPVISLPTIEAAKAWIVSDGHHVIG